MHPVSNHCVCGIAHHRLSISSPSTLASSRFLERSATHKRTTNSPHYLLSHPSTQLQLSIAISRLLSFFPPPKQPKTPQTCSPRLSSLLPSWPSPPLSPLLLLPLPSPTSPALSATSSLLDPVTPTLAAFSPPEQATLL